MIANLFLAIGCTQSNFSDAQIPDAAGRLISVTNSYPGVVMVISPFNSGLCTGSIVSRRAVLTARHCLQQAGTYTVRTKNGDFYTSTRERTGTGEVDDPNDISMLVFSSDITTDDSDIYPIATAVAKGDAVAVVGFGCNNVENRAGSGVKRAGTNRVYAKDDYLTLMTPKAGFRGIIGDANQAGTCFGDSGGPLFSLEGERLVIVGVTHAGGVAGQYYVSEFVNVADNRANRRFIASVESKHSLTVEGI